MSQLVRQNSQRKSLQPGVQSDGIQQLQNVDECYDMNANLSRLLDPFGNDFSAGRRDRVNTITANYTAIGADTDGQPDSVILINGTTKTVTLPVPGLVNTGQRYTIKLIANSTGTVSGGAVNIDAATTYSLSAQYKYVTVINDGTQWWIIGNN